MLFRHFPEITYNGHKTRDITRHASFISDLMNDPFVYLPYTLQDREKPEDVSYLYYGTVEYTPYVLMANNIIDPYTDWLMTDEEFQNYIIKKYAKTAKATGFDVVRWASSHQRFDNIVEWRKDDFVKSMDTYIDEYVPDNQQSSFYDTLENKPYQSFHPEWVPVRIYDWEYEKNEMKRAINVIDRSKIDAVHSQFIKVIQK